MIERHGRQPNGEPVIYRGLGYASDAWRRAAESMTRANARQTVGRARANTPAGVPVVAVTTEDTGLPVLPAAALPRSHTDIERVVEAMEAAGACAISPIDSNRESGTSRTPVYGLSRSRLREYLPGVPLRTLARWLNTAVEAGAVVHTGQTSAARYVLPPRPEPPEPPPAPLVLDPLACPACGGRKHDDIVSLDGQIGKRRCAVKGCGAFITYTIWNGNPVTMPPRPPPLSARVLDVAATLQE